MSSLLNNLIQIGYNNIHFYIIFSITAIMMSKIIKHMLQLIDEQDTQQAFAEYLKTKRKQAKLSREKLAVKSGVPAPTIKKFENTGQISLRQFLLLWLSLDNIS